MTFTSIVSRLTNNFFSRLTLLFFKTTHLTFWNRLVAKDSELQETSYNLAPLMGVILGFIIAVIAILGRLVFDYRIIATIIAFICYLFFGFAKALYGLAHLVGNTQEIDAKSASGVGRCNLNRWGIIVAIFAIILWCASVTYMRPARLFLSLMSAICISRFASCIVIYAAQSQPQNGSEEAFDKIDLAVSMLCTAPWLLLALERSLASLIFATAFSIIITKHINRHGDSITDQISSVAIVITEIFTLLIWII